MAQRNNALKENLMSNDGSSSEDWECVDDNVEDISYPSSVSEGLYPPPSVMRISLHFSDSDDSLPGPAKEEDLLADAQKEAGKANTTLDSIEPLPEDSDPEGEIEDQEWENVDSTVEIECGGWENIDSEVEIPPGELGNADPEVKVEYGASGHIYPEVKIQFGGLENVDPGVKVECGKSDNPGQKLKGQSGELAKGVESEAIKMCGKKLGEMEKRQEENASAKSIEGKSVSSETDSNVSKMASETEAEEYREEDTSSGKGHNKARGTRAKVPRLIRQLLMLGIMVYQGP